MRPAFLKYTLARMSAPLFRWRGRSVRMAARALYSAHGGDAIALLREQIVSCPRYSDRKRLYRLHDEIARRLAGPS